MAIVDLVAERRGVEVVPTRSKWSPSILQSPLQS